MILRELVTRLGFELDDKNLKKFEASIDSAKTKLASLSISLNAVKMAATGIVATATGLSLLSLSVAKSVKSTQLLADKLNITTDDLQSLELAAQVTGLEVNELSDSFTKFHANLGDITSGNTAAAKEIQKLGISLKDNQGITKSSFELYEEAAKKISLIKNPIKQTAALQKLLGTSNIEVAKLFDGTSGSLEKQREEVLKLGYIIDTKGIKTAKEFSKSWSNFQIILGSVKKELAIRFMPVFSDVINMFKDWFGSNRKLISQNITSFINILSKAISFLGKVIGLILTPIQYLINIMGGLENAVSVIGTTLAILFIPRLIAATTAVYALTTAMLSNPITLIIAAVVALAVAIALMVNDIYHWVQGNNSAIGEILKRWLGFEGTFKDIVDSVTGYFTEKFKALGEWFSSFFDGILNSISGATDKVTGVVSKIRDKTVFRKVSDEEAAIIKGRRVDFGGGITPKFANNGIGKPIINPTSSFNGIASSSNTSNNSKVNQYITENVTVNVPTGTTTEQSRAISLQVAEEMQIQFNNNIQRGLDSLSNR